MALTFLLDEFKTSKCCPGCGSNLEDKDNNYRIRRCTNDPGTSKNSCSLSTTLKPYECNRDKSTVLNMARIAHDVMSSLKWPNYLKRENRSVDRERKKLVSNTFQIV